VFTQIDTGSFMDTAGLTFFPFENLYFLNHCIS